MSIIRAIRIDQTKAKPGNKEYFDGNVKTQELVSPAGGEEAELLAVFFDAGARTKPHIHEYDQILHIIEGNGIVATDTEKHLVSQGDVILIPNKSWHWHGATRDSAMCHISIKRPGNDNWKVDVKNWASDY